MVLRYWDGLSGNKQKPDNGIVLYCGDRVMVEHALMKEDQMHHEMRIRCTRRSNASNRHDVRNFVLNGHANTSSVNRLSTELNHTVRRQFALDSNHIQLLQDCE